MKAKLFCALALAGASGAQVLVVDRAANPATARSRAMERRSGGFVGDSFRLGAAGQNWMIDAVRVWAAAPPAACGVRAGDRVAGITLYGALDNPPVPGEPYCECHGLLAVAHASFAPGSDAPMNSNARVSQTGRFWQIDFEQVNWSVPGGADVLFSVRAVGRPGTACGTDLKWALATGAARAGHRLRLFDKKAVPEALADSRERPVWISVQVRGHRL